MQDERRAVEGEADVEPFSWSGVGLEECVEGEVGGAGEAKAEHGASEGEPEKGVVAFVEAEGVVQFAEGTHDGVWVVWTEFGSHDMRDLGMVNVKMAWVFRDRAVSMRGLTTEKEIRDVFVFLPRRIVKIYDAIACSSTSLGYKCIWSMSRGLLREMDDHSAGSQCVCEVSPLFSQSLPVWA